MRLWFFAFTAILLGVFVGAASALWQTDIFSPRLIKVQTTPLDMPDLPALPPAGGPEPRLVIDTPHYYFGKMERKAKGRHTFVLKNVGDYPLELVKGKTSCKCTLSDMTQTKIDPGESLDVTLEWEAKTHDSLFRQDATIYTNDPRRQMVKLTIEGIVVDSIVVTPPEVVFSNLTADEDATGKTRVFTSLTDNLEIVGHTFDNEETSQFFAIESDPLPKEILPENMQSGREIRITLKPGLPPGNVQQKIRLQLNIPDVPDAEIPIKGRIGSPILIVGPRGWDQERGLLRLGTIDRAKGTKVQLKVMIRGPHRQQIEMRNVQSQPESLHVTLQTSEELGNVLAVPMSIEIPPGSPVADHLGNAPGSLGEITIETNQPEIGQLKFNVAFAVTD
jgi:Protein of unknown function (DUF1573)